MHSVVLVDDQVLFVESLRSVIESRSDDFRVVGVYYGGDEAIEAVRRLKPDIVLMDVRMPGTDGVVAARRIFRDNPSTRVVMLTTYDDDAYVHEAVKQGAIGYLLKDMPPDALISAMRSALDGQFQIPSKLADKLIGNQSKTRNQASRTFDTLSVEDNRGYDPPDWLFDLSRKERMILRLVVDGFDNQEIAERVYLAPQTVKNYVSRLYAKADVDSRSHLIREARGLVQYL